MSSELFDSPTPSFVRRAQPGGENNYFGLQGSGLSLAQADFGRGFSAALRLHLPLWKHTRCPRQNSCPQGFLIHRSPRRATLARKKLGVDKNCLMLREAPSHPAQRRRAENWAAEERRLGANYFQFLKLKDWPQPRVILRLMRTVG
jgi:hypothetical protein